MKKVLLRVAVTVMAIVIAISGLGIAVAQEWQDGTEMPVLVVGLQKVVQVDESVTITVTERSSDAVVEGASVYALRLPRLGLTGSVNMVTAQGYIYEFLGKTNSDGQVGHIFDRAGMLLIVATKEGYGPGIAWLTVKPGIEGRLAIDAPERVKVDEPVTIKVFEKNSGDGVAEADVWAINLPLRLSIRDMTPSIDDARAWFEELRGTYVGNMTEILDALGQYLGQTSNSGELEHAFSEVGIYLLVSTKSGYVPGFAKIVTVADEALVVKADPRRADVGEDITLAAITRGTGTPVEGVELYALSMGSIGPLALPLRQNDAGSFSLSEIVIENGEYLGATNAAGEFDHQFAEEGIYLIVGVKDEFVPGVTFVAVGMFGGLGQILPLFGKFRESLGWEELLPQLRQLGERFSTGLWQFGRDR